jgi:HTH-type transcriptional regulator/antitoxin HigA
MNKVNRNRFNPDYASPPGETLLETLVYMDMSQADLAARTGRPKKHINEIIKGKAAITPGMALQLERVTGVSANFWNNRECQYRETLARLNEQRTLNQQLDWLGNFPVKTMVSFGWIESSENRVQQFRILLNFFGVASPEQFQNLLDEQTAFRKSEAFDTDRAALAAWLRKGEIDAQRVKCNKYDGKEFRNALLHVRKLSRARIDDAFNEVIDKCADTGVAVVFTRELPKTRVSGATRWLSANKAMIQLCLRYKTDDQLWFTFFHEAGHILLHGKRDVFVEKTQLQSQDIKEVEANTFASNILIPEAMYRKFAGRNITEETVQSFSSDLDIAPGILVGRLQHDGHLPFNKLNHLKKRLEWKTS